MTLPKTTSAEIAHSIDLMRKAEARLRHQKRLLVTMSGSLDGRKRADAEKLASAMDARLVKLRADHEILLANA